MSQNLSSAAVMIGALWDYPKILLSSQFMLTQTQYKRTGHWRKYKAMLLRLYFSAISKYYSQTIDFEHTIAYKRLLPVCKAEILQVTVKIIEVFSSFEVDF